MTTLAAIVFWLSALLLVYTHVGYTLVLYVIVRARRAAGSPAAPVPTSPPSRPGSPSSSPPTTRRR